MDAVAWTWFQLLHGGLRAFFVLRSEHVGIEHQQQVCRKLSTLLGGLSSHSTSSYVIQAPDVSGINMSKATATDRWHTFTSQKAFCSEVPG